jgi:hypothetical protein
VRGELLKRIEKVGLRCGASVSCRNQCEKREDI